VAHQREHKAERDKVYRRARPGYDHRRWRQLSRQLLARQPTCQRCGRRPSAHAHHLDGQSPAMPNGMNPARLEAVCTSCHGKVHAGVLPRSPESSGRTATAVLSRDKTPGHPAGHVEPEQLGHLGARGPRTILPGIV
jgi:5-methylcytosine-specific restriction endonuclease McrA